MSKTSNNGNGHQLPPPPPPPPPPIVETPPPVVVTPPDPTAVHATTLQSIGSELQTSVGELQSADPAAFTALQQVAFDLSAYMARPDGSLASLTADEFASTSLTLAEVTATDQNFNTVLNDILLLASGPLSVQQTHDLLVDIGLLETREPAIFNNATSEFATITPAIPSPGLPPAVQTTLAGIGSEYNTTANHGDSFVQTSADLEHYIQNNALGADAKITLGTALNEINDLTHFQASGQWGSNAALGVLSDIDHLGVFPAVNASAAPTFADTAAQATFLSNVQDGLTVNGQNIATVASGQTTNLPTQIVELTNFLSFVEKGNASNANVAPQVAQVEAAGNVALHALNDITHNGVTAQDSADLVAASSTFNHDVSALTAHNIIPSNFSTPHLAESFWLTA